MTFDWHTILGLTSSAILVAILFPYVSSILHGPTRPNVVSWAGWALLSGIATAIQFSEGASWSVVVPLLATVSTAIVAIFAIRLGYAKFTRSDIICIGLGIIAIGMWLIARAPLVSILLAILADTIVTIPTYLKTYRDPFSEPAWLWFIYIVGATLGVIASTSPDRYNLTYPIYLVLSSSAIWLLALRGRLKRI